MDTRYVLTPVYHLETMGNELVLIPADLHNGKVIVLNKIGQLVLRGIVEGKTQETIVENLSISFQEERSQVQDDVREFLKGLIILGAVTAA